MRALEVSIRSSTLRIAAQNTPENRILITAIQLRPAALSGLRFRLRIAVQLMLPAGGPRDTAETHISAKTDGPLETNQA
jgi:hypothetical protein